MRAVETTTPIIMTCPMNDLAEIKELYRCGRSVMMVDGWSILYESDRIRTSISSSVHVHVGFALHHLLSSVSVVEMRTDRHCVLAGDTRRALLCYLENSHTLVITMPLLCGSECIHMYYGTCICNMLICMSVINDLCFCCLIHRVTLSICSH